MAQLSTPDELSLREIPRRAARMFGELASTFVSGNVCIVGRLADAGELTKREPYRRVVVFGRGRTFLEAFEQAERHHREGTSDEILDLIDDAVRGRPRRVITP